MRKRLIGHCPCGYVFVIFAEEKKAISLVQSHFDRFHKDLLPFGISSSEALAILNDKIGYERTDVVKSAFYPNQTKTDSISKKASRSKRRKKGTIAQLAEP